MEGKIGWDGGGGCAVDRMKYTEFRVTKIGDRDAGPRGTAAEHLVSYDSVLANLDLSVPIPQPWIRSEFVVSDIQRAGSKSCIVGQFSCIQDV